MLPFESFYDFLEWFLSGAGLALFSTFCTQAIKKYLKWEGDKAFALNAAVSLALMVLAFFTVKYEWYLYLEDIWPMLVVWAMIIFGGSQLVYRFTPKREQK